MVSGVGKLRATAVVTSDASGNWGCRAYTSTGEWFMLQWPLSWMRIYAYNSKGAAATGGGGGNVGQEVVGWLSSMSL